VSPLGSEKTAGNKLGVTTASWRLLRRLANDAPLKQGRHRGKMAGLLRHATAGELNEAREVAAFLINSYLRWLDSNP
jgi:hypothetical protein